MTADTRSLRGQPGLRPSGGSVSPPAWGGTPRRVAEIGGRACLAVLVWWLLAPVFWHDVLHFERVTSGLSPSHLPYRDFLWEFPPLSLLPVLVSHLGGPLFPVLFVSLMIGCEYAGLELLRRGFPARARLIGRWWHLTVLPLAVFAWFRLDFLSVLAATAGLAALLRGRAVARWVILGFAAKVWPAVLVAGLVATRRTRDAAVALAGIGALLAAWWLWSPSGFASFLAYRRGGGLQVESTLGALRLLAGADVSVVSGAWVVDQGGWGWVDPAGLALVGAVAACALVAARHRTVDVVRLCASLTVLLMVSGRILSPQYLVWAAPFVVLLAAARDRVVAWLFGTAVLLTLLPLVDYHAFVGGNPAFAVGVVVRNVLLWALAAYLLWTAFGGSEVELEAEAPDR